MKTIKFTTKKGRKLAYSYEIARHKDIYQVYKTFSTKKYVAQDNCRNQMIKEGGRDFRIISWNTFGFTCGWRTKNSIRIETKNSSYEITDLPFTI